MKPYLCLLYHTSVFPCLYSFLEKKCPHILMHHSPSLPEYQLLYRESYLPLSFFSYLHNLCIFHWKVINQNISSQSHEAYLKSEDDLETPNTAHHTSPLLPFPTINYLWLNLQIINVFCNSINDNTKISCYNNWDGQNKLYIENHNINQNHSSSVQDYQLSQLLFPPYSETYITMHFMFFIF